MNLLSSGPVRSHRIDVRGLTKKYGPDTVVDDLSFTVEPGHVTGFLGPNGAGKSTTMRMIMGLATPTHGSATIGGRHYRDLPVPLTHVGALLDAGAVHPSRSARDHLLALAASNGLPARRVDAVLDRTGLTKVAGKHAGGFSLGMRQRLGIAAALLGDPGVLIFDEPVNGLDPEGIRWIRGFMRSLAHEGRAVLVSSHLMSEDTSMNDFMAANSEGTVLVRCSEPEVFARLLTAAGAAVRDGLETSLVVAGLTAAEIGKLAAYNDIVLSELAPQQASLEDAFMELTKDSLEYLGATS
jgi:ABC-2 type transport system ATP-binding protein